MPLAGLALAITTAAVTVLAGWLIVAGAADGPQAVVSSVAAPIVDLVAALFVLRAAFAARPGRIRAAWALIGAALVMYAIGDGLWAWIATFQGEDPFPSPADAAYLAFYAIAGGALLLFPSPSIARREVVRLAIDSGIVVLGGGMVVWHSLIHPLLGAPYADPVSNTLALAYPVGDLALLFAVATIALRRPVGIDSRALVALVAGLGLMFIADVAYGEAELAGTPDAWWVDVCYLAFGLAVALAGYLQARTTSESGIDETRRVGGLLLLLPYAALAGGFGVLVEAAQAAGGGQVVDLAAGAIGLTVLVLIRQEVINRDNGRLLADAARRETEARYQRLESQASDAFLLVDDVGIVAYASPSLERVVDVDGTALVGRRVTDLAHADDAAALTTLLADTAANRPVTPLEWRAWTRQGQWRQVETIPSNLLHDPAIGKIVLTTRDVGERKALRLQVAQAALRDALTGIPNRVLFEDRVAQSIVAADRLGTATAVILLDLDDFSRVNGTFGHAIGDRILREVARRLSATVRAADTVARVGGDGFGVLLSGAGSAAEAIEIARRIGEALLEPMTQGPTTFELTAAIGIATSEGKPAIDAGQLFRDADVAMTVASEEGRGRVVVFESSMQRDIEGRYELEAQLRQAIANDQLVLEYQPIVDLEHRELMAAEALVRWDHPTRGRLGPNLFIPLAEQTGLIGDIGAWVLREACREVARWARIAPGRIPRVSVNLAAPQLADPQLPWLVQATLAQAGAAPSWLTLEVTESLLISDMSDVIERLHAIRALGVQISVDDFGTGYSSLAYLQQFPINHIKIDRSFVTPLDDPEGGPGLVPAIIEIARALGMSTVAEGIETERQRARLLELGCTLGQGYLFARPTSGDALLEIVRASDPIVAAVEAAARVRPWTNSDRRRRRKTASAARR